MHRLALSFLFASVSMTLIPTFGADYYSSSNSNTHGYYSSASNANYLSSGNRATEKTIAVRIRRPEPRWMDSNASRPLPINSVIGGGEYGDTQYVCRAAYRSGVHPGKIVGQHCNIAYGGKEIVMERYQVLVSIVDLQWAPANYGFIPPNAIEGGYENGKPLFICQSDYRGGRHIGKIVGKNCNFGWGGKEVLSPIYNVLVR